MKYCAKVLLATIVFIASCKEDNEQRPSIDFSVLSNRKWMQLTAFKQNDGKIIGLDPGICYDRLHLFLEIGESNYVVECKTGNKDGVSYPIACVSACKDTTIRSVWSVDHATPSIKFNVGDGTKDNPFWKVHTLNDTVLIATKFEEGLLTGSTDVYLKAIE